MLRHILMIWLVTCMLGYGSAWALDGHIDESSQHETLPDSHAHDDDGEEHASCDHCCHASAHITGIWAQQTEITIPDDRGAWPPCCNDYYSILIPPPGHPPKS